jgi:hypothetical protein
MFLIPQVEMSTSVLDDWDAVGAQLIFPAFPCHCLSFLLQTTHSDCPLTHVQGMLLALLLMSAGATGCHLQPYA